MVSFPADKLLFLPENLNPISHQKSDPLKWNSILFICIVAQKCSEVLVENI